MPQYGRLPAKGGRIGDGRRVSEFNVAESDHSAD
jgi:hypothetical protein